ncbi:MAG TPA: hypothetical protein VNX21_03765 [Candidatus Thermoplasmatota archaeon]|nr:hypothetical protein [Candidatus Thermoplasmatota archaeon]
MSTRAASILALALLALAPPVLAGAGEQVATGSLVLNFAPIAPTDLATYLLGDAIPAPGVDAVRVTLARAAQGGEPVRLSWTSGFGADLYVRFYDARYTWLAGGAECLDGMGRLLFEGERACLAPAGAQHALVGLRMGQGADFTLRYAHG